MRRLVIGSMGVPLFGTHLLLLDGEGVTFVCFFVDGSSPKKDPNASFAVGVTVGVMLLD